MEEARQKPADNSQDKETGNEESSTGFNSTEEEKAGATEFKYKVRQDHNRQCAEASLI